MTSYFHYLLAARRAAPFFNPENRDYALRYLIAYGALGPCATATKQDRLWCGMNIEVIYG